METDPIRLTVASVEAHFVFFYDLKARIISVSNTLPIGTGFEWRRVELSELSMFYFSDQFVARWVRAHFHGSVSTIDNEQDFSINYVDPHRGGESFQFKFEFPTAPFITNHAVESYNFLECTLFENGIIAVTVRVRNKTELFDDQYLALIQRPERLPSHSDTGALVALVDSIVKSKIEPKLALYLNQIEITATHIDGGIPRRLHVHEAGATDPTGPTTFKATATITPRDQGIWPGQTIDRETLIRGTLTYQSPSNRLDLIQHSWTSSRSTALNRVRLDAYFTVSKEVDRIWELLST